MGKTPFFCTLNGNLVVKMRDNLGRKLVYTFLGENALDDTCQILVRDFSELNMVPQEVAVNLNPSAFEITMDKDSFDYIYRIDDIVAFKGKRTSKRAKIDKFERTYKDVKVERVQINNESVVRDVMNLFDRWVDQKGRNMDDSDTERQALERFMMLGDHISSVNICVYLNDKMIGFSFCEVLHNGFAFGPFAKSDYEHKGLDSYLFYRTALELQREKCKLWNVDCDLGFKGLRYYKRSWGPACMLKKYNVTAH